MSTESDKKLSRVAGQDHKDVIFVSGWPFLNQPGIIVQGFCLEHIIHLIPKRPPFKYSFVFFQISPCRLFLNSKF